MSIPGFSHRAGVHCGSTAFRDVLRHSGVELSEELVFGLGAGLGFSLHSGDTALSPPQPGRFLIGRSASFEQDLCSNLGAELDMEVFASTQEAWSRAREHLADGRPVLAYADLRELPYLGARAHWYGHLIVLIGHEGSGPDEVALVADNERAEVERVPLPALLRALCNASVTRLPGTEGGDCTLLTIRNALPLGEPALRRGAGQAIGLQALRLTEDATESSGLPGLAALPAELRSWEQREDWQRCLRQSAQVIEVRGSGGGLFRRLYARFLEEAAQLGEPRAAALVPLCLESADAFSALAAELETARQRPEPELDRAAALASRCSAVEAALWERALASFGGTE